MIDQSAPVDATPFGIRVMGGGKAPYWIDFRQQFTGNSYLMNGVGLHWLPWSGSNGGTQLLYTTPGSAGGKTDSAIVSGSAYQDVASGISVTPLSKSGTFPEAIDVRIDLATVPAIISSMSISPSSTYLAVDQKVQFTVTATQPAFTWSVTGCGTMSASGLFSATSTGKCKAQAVSSGIAGLASISVSGSKRGGKP